MAGEPVEREPPERVRMDKWLWAVRIFRTRRQAAEACRAGHVRIAGRAVRPARLVAPGEVVAATVGRRTRIVRALELVERRVGARALARHLEDLAPVRERRPRPEAAPAPRYDKAPGRPTKRDRRDLERLEEDLRRQGGVPGSDQRPP